jgi:hypothetical protein
MREKTGEGIRRAGEGERGRKAEQRAGWRGKGKESRRKGDETGEQEGHSDRVEESMKKKRR